MATDRDAQALDQLAEEITQAGGQTVTVTGDICDDALPTLLAQTAMARFGRLDILINNAGAGSAMVPLWEIEPEVWRQDISLNLGSQFMMCHAVVPHMLAAGYGRIVNVASAAGMEGHALSGGYAAAKAGVIAMTKTLGKELARQGVLVNAIAPALIESRMLQAESMDRLQRHSAGSVWLEGGCKSWYVDPRSGRLTLVWPDYAHAFRDENSRFHPEGYLLSS